MGILGKIFGAANPITTSVNAAGAIATLVDKFVETPEEKAAGALLLAKLQMQPHLAQLSINQVEAAHRSMFVAGWRPFIGWVSGIGLAYNFIVYPILLWASINFFADIVPPPLETEMLMSLVLALLGLGGMRTYEKVNGATR